MNRDEEWLLNEKYLGDRTEDFFVDCERLKAGEPLAYVIGHIPFGNATIYLDSRPLIPRPETEFWTNVAIERMKAETETFRVLDLCAGSGCIGVAVLTTLPNTQVDFVEIDTSHHSTIQKNLETNNIDAARARIFGGDLFENVSEKYTYILTNPPYIDPKLDRAETSVKIHEPHGALYGGTAGMELIKKILESASRYLTHTGTLFLEHEPEQSEEILTLGKMQGFNGTVYPDQYGILRYTVFTREPEGTMAG